ncbi:MAG: hypothetical protein AAGJ80_13620, partial [Cyanobacteria bacterium J06553_1]
MTQPDAIRELLQAVAAGDLSPELAFETLQETKNQGSHLQPKQGQPGQPKQGQSAQGYESVGDFAKIDHART